MTPSEMLVNLARARTAYREAKRAWQQKSAELGVCDGPNHQEPRCFEQKGIERSEWCEVCDGKEDAHAAYRKAANASAAALRSAIACGRRLAREAPHA